MENVRTKTRLYLSQRRKGRKEKRLPVCKRLHAIRDASNTILDQVLVEINEQAKFHFRQLQIG
jgi:hypothetical protein